MCGDGLAGGAADGELSPAERSRPGRMSCGKWNLCLAPEQAGGPYTLTVSGDGPERRSADLLVGDVWFASGQSNMEMPLNGFPPNAVVKDAAKEIAAATNPKLRLLLVKQKARTLPLNDITTSWTDVHAGYGSEVLRGRVLLRAGDCREGECPGGADRLDMGRDAGGLVGISGHAGDASRSCCPRSRRGRILRTSTDGPRGDDGSREGGGRRGAGCGTSRRRSIRWHPDEASWLPAGIYNGMVAPFTP